MFNEGEKNGMQKQIGSTFIKSTQFLLNKFQSKKEPNIVVNNSIANVTNLTTHKPIIHSFPVISRFKCVINRNQDTSIPDQTTAKVRKSFS